MHSFTTVILSLLIASVLSAPPNCSKPPPEVTATKIRQCCNGPPIDKIMKETYGGQCNIPNKAPSGPTSAPVSTASSNPVSSTASNAVSTAASNTASSTTSGSSSAATSASSTQGSIKPSGGFKPSAAASCAAECMLNQTQVFNGGQYNKANANNFLNDIIKDDDFTEILQKSMEECSVKSQQTSKALEDPNAKCSPFSSLYLHCVNDHANQKCPESRWLQTTTCNKVRSFITTCGVPNF